MRPRVQCLLSRPLRPRPPKHQRYVILVDEFTQRRVHCHLPPWPKQRAPVLAPWRITSHIMMIGVLFANHLIFVGPACSSRAPFLTPHDDDPESTWQVTIQTQVSGRLCWLMDLNSEC
mmetsp:Transcript_22729/g.49263  ORF Transcript_22729/g.49263 Transcript_22729/m.49263 type:complete len:118 (+) Transcript_22729:522-875(+)